MIFKSNNMANYTIIVIFVSMTKYTSIIGARSQHFFSNTLAVLVFKWDIHISW